jgi:hypothetical protein
MKNYLYALQWCLPVLFFTIFFLIMNPAALYMITLLFSSESGFIVKLAMIIVSFTILGVVIFSLSNFIIYLFGLDMSDRTTYSWKKSLNAQVIESVSKKEVGDLIYLGYFQAVKDKIDQRWQGFILNLNLAIALLAALVITLLTHMGDEDFIYSFPGVVITMFLMVLCLFNGYKEYLEAHFLIKNMKST